MVNAAFMGGGVSAVVGLGAYSRFMVQNNEYASFSGASIGALIAVCLSMEVSPIEIRNFLGDNVMNFSQFIEGKKFIEIETNKFLDNMLYRNLPKECLVSIAPLRLNFPQVITRENSEELTVGQVVAMSATYPLLFLPSKVTLSGKTAIVLDGGLVLNPPLNDKMDNVIFGFDRIFKKRILTPWKIKQRLQEEKAEKVIKPKTVTSTLGYREDIMVAFEEGRLLVGI